MQLYTDIQKITLSGGCSTRLVDTGGEKPTVILVHGLANAIEIWHPVIAHLQEDFRVIAFDLPGFGEADRPDVDYGLDFFSQYLEEMVDHLNLSKFNLVGYSLGGSIIIRYCANNPDKLQRLVLASPGGFGRNTHWTMRLPSLPLIGGLLGYPSTLNTRLTLKLTINDHEKITPDLVAIMNHHASISGSWRSNLRTLRQGVGLWGVKGRDAAIKGANSIEAYTQVIWGRQDRVFPLSHSKALMEALPNAQLTIFEDCGHYPHWGYPKKFASAVRTHILESGT